MEVAGKRLDTETSSAQYQANLCESCEVESFKTPANGVCKECNEHMCSKCFKDHLKGKLCRHHVLLSFEEFSSLSLESGSKDVTKCEKHDSEIIKFYCRSHDVVGCGDCIVLEHTSCKPEYIKDLAKAFIDSDMHKVIVKRVEQLKEKKNSYGRDNEKSKDELKAMNEKTLKEIRLFRAEINKCLDDAEANILSKLQKLTRENAETQTKIDKIIQTLSSELEKVKQLLNTQLHRENALFINAVTCKSKLDDMENVYENKEKNGVLKKFEFVRNEHLSGLLKSTEPLGNLKIYASIREETKQKQIAIGVRVRRGPKSLIRKMGGGGPGTVTGFSTNGNAHVQWDDDSYSYHRVENLEII